MGSGDALISIVVPVYGTEAYLPQCVESLLAQTHSHLELILIDDGSPDHSGALCDRYGEQDQRVLVIHQENQGVSTARNAGVKAVTDSTSLCVDSDDWVGGLSCGTLQAAEQSEADAVVEVSGHRRMSGQAQRPCGSCAIRSNLTQPPGASCFVQN